VKFTQGSMEYNQGWLVQAEAPPGALFRKFKSIITSGCASKSDIAFYFVHWLTDLAGAEPYPLEGCEKYVLKFPTKVLTAFMASFQIVERLSARTETEVFEEYLVWRWTCVTPSLGPAPSGRHSIAKLRLVIMAQGNEEKVLEAYSTLPTGEQRILSEELARTGCASQLYARDRESVEELAGPAFLVYYAPALMQKNCSSDARVALSVLAEILKEARSLWPLDTEAADQTVTLRIDAVKEIELTALGLPSDDYWVLLRTSSRDAQVKRLSLTGADEKQQDADWTNQRVLHFPGGDDGSLRDGGELGVGAGAHPEELISADQAAAGDALSEKVEVLQRKLEAHVGAVEELRAASGAHDAKVEALRNELAAHAASQTEELRAVDGAHGYKTASLEEKLRAADDAQGSKVEALRTDLDDKLGAIDDMLGSKVEALRRELDVFMVSQQAVLEGTLRAADEAQGSKLEALRGDLEAHIASQKATVSQLEAHRSVDEAQSTQVEVLRRDLDAHIASQQAASLEEKLAAVGTVQGSQIDALRRDLDAYIACQQEVEAMRAYPAGGAERNVEILRQELGDQIAKQGVSLEEKLCVASEMHTVKVEALRAIVEAHINSKDEHGLMEVRKEIKTLQEDCHLATSERDELGLMLRDLERLVMQSPHLETSG
jgi:hypothetical protein